MTVSSFVFTNLVKIGDAAPEEIAIFIGDLSTTDGISVFPFTESSAILTNIFFSLANLAIKELVLLSLVAAIIKNWLLISFSSNFLAS